MVNVTLIGKFRTSRKSLAHIPTHHSVSSGPGRYSEERCADHHAKNDLADAVCFGLAGSPFSTVTNTTVRIVWTVGGGVDARFYGNWTPRGEYRYSDFGAWNNSFALGAGGPPSATTVGTQLNINTQIVLVGIIYKFGQAIGGQVPISQDRVTSPPFHHAFRRARKSLPELAGCRCRTEFFRLFANGFAGFGGVVRR
jgi:hypothetical protein